MNLELFALTFDFLGKVLLGIMAILVHKRIKKEHKIDKEVLKEMKLEQSVGILAIAFIVLGYVMHLMVM